MARPLVTAVILPSGGLANPTVAALELQSQPVDRILVASQGGAVEAGDARWVWLLESGLVPEPSALEHLLAAAAALSPAPVLLASRVVTAEGELEPNSIPVPAVHEPDRVLAALGQRVLALRAARSGSLLVTAGALERLGPASGTALLHRDLQWSARLLRDELGVLAPGSVVVRPPGAERREQPAVRLATVARLMSELEPGERVWFVVHLAERAVRYVPSGDRRSPSHTARRIARALAPLRRSRM